MIGYTHGCKKVIPLALVRILSPKTFAARFFLAGSLLCFSFLNAATLNLPWNIDVSALSYQQDVGVSFTFTPTVRLTLSTTDIHIYNLAPGAASDSNIITLNILTNTANGYTLNASVGNDTTFNTNELIHSNSNISNTFSNLSTTASLASNTDLGDNEWGYSYLDEAVDKGSGVPNTIWENYSGLPLYSDTTNIANLKTSTTPVDNAAGDNIKFKIAAKASTTQPSGEYNNVINFTLVATPIPTTISMAYENAGKEKHLGYYKMQDMTSEICSAVEVLDEGSQTQVIDIRDNKIYWITKLQDGKCWMTQNLDHNIDKDFAYTPTNTDIPTNWVPDKSTYPTGTTIWEAASYYIQQSYDPGDKIWDGTPSNPGQTLDTMAQGSNLHYHLGNYYNWGAAVAMNDTSAYTTNNTDLDQSICPAGWTLPKNDNSIGSFQYMVERYGWANNNMTMTNPYAWEEPLYFPFSGGWTNYSFGIGASAHLWSPVVASEYNASTMYYSQYSAAYVYPRFSELRTAGCSVRCVSR